MASKLNQVSENEAPDSFYYKALSEISSGFYKIIKFLIDFNKNTKCNDNVNVTGYNWVNDDSVYGVFGWGVFKFFEGLSACLKHDELMRGIAIIPWSLFTFEKQGNTPLYKRLHYHVLNKLKYNLEEFRHPLISRLIINLDGISEPRNIEPFHSPIFNDFMALLKKNYLNIFQNNPEFSRKILPKSTYYDSIDNKIVKTYPSGSESFLTVDIVFSESVVE